MLWIGITGGIAMGKSRVCQTLVERGFAVLQADQVVHELLSKNGGAVTKVLDEFGTEVKSADGGIDRKKLGAQVFADPLKLRKLEAILHPLVQSSVQDRRANLEKLRTAVAFYEIPLLFEKNLQDQFDEIIVVVADELVQIQRLKSREKLSDLEIRNRLNVQIPIAQKIKQADVVIDNNGNETDLKHQVESKIIARYQAQT